MPTNAASESRDIKCAQPPLPQRTVAFHCGMGNRNRGIKHFMNSK